MIKITETDQRFYVKESTLPGAGLGLFAKHPLQKGGHLEIIGVMVERGSIADQCTAFSDNYKFGSKSVDEIYHIVPFGWAAMINNANSPEQQNCEIRHIRSKISNKKLKDYKGITSYSGEAVYYFRRDISKDEELIGNYGHEWEKHKKWVDQYSKVCDEREDDWKKFLSFDLYNLTYMNSRIPLGA